mgnify:CR=1 FL=1
MKINTFEFEDKSRQWKLSKTSFEKLTLLVGASGVGKTQILRAIHALKEISKGESINGIFWRVNFNTATGDSFDWEGEFEEKDVPVFDTEEDESVEKTSKIVFEKIYKNSELLVDREQDKIVFKGSETIKLTREKSLLSHLEEDFINEMKDEIGKIQLSDHSDSLREPFKINLFNANKLAKKYSTLTKIRQADLDIRVKLFLAYKSEKKTFSRIKERFIDIFPQVEDIKIAPIEFEEDDDVLPFMREYPFIQIKEIGVPKWVRQNMISSGMFRSLIHISQLYLSAEGTLFLIDEFENSLGINCIDELTSDILQSRRSLQFILTSHHPYIINSISFKNWKLVTRTEGIVHTRNATELNLGKSKHDAFMQLLQLEEYQTGSEII